jgi:ABC-2 type transport system permease protein
MLALFRTEMAKQWLRPRTYVALSLMVAIPLIIMLALKANPPSPPEDLRDPGDSFAYLATKTGAYFGVAALQFMSRFLLVIVVALFAGDAIASEASWGNLRAMLVRPITRGRLFSTKLASAVLLSAVAAALILITGIVAGLLAFGWHTLGVSTLTFAPQSNLHIVANLALATLYVSWQLASVVALGFMVSAMSDTPAAAVFAAIGFYVVSQILDGIRAIGSIRDVFPTHYFDAWQHLFTTNGGPTTDMLRGTLLQLGYVVAFLGVAWWWFRRKDILS